VRLEITLKKELAELAAAILSSTDDIHGATAGIIRSRFNFIERTDENISRCPLADWWVDFLEGSLDVKLSPKPRNKLTIERQAEWLKLSISRVLARVYHAMGDAELKELLRHGKDKLTDSDKAQIEHFKRRHRRCIK
jgi:hypothetical protein